MRNFKKTLSLVLSVLMLVSCCSVVFSTFATAYTTNDTAGSANYGVYTYDFIKEDGTSAYGTNGSISHNLMACGGKSNLSLGNSTQIDRRFLAGASYIGTEGNRKGMHLVGYTAASLADGANWKNNWGSRAFILDDTAISKPADAANGANFLTLQDHTTYTFIVKYKLESLDAAYYVGVPGNTYNPNGIGYDPTISSSVNPPEGKTYEAGDKASKGEFASTGAYIGLGYMDPSAIKETGVSNTAGSSGQSIAFTNGWSDRIDAVQDEWQYLNVTVNADDITLHTTSGMQTKYVHLLVRSVSNEKPVMFHIESITVITEENGVAPEDVTLVSIDKTGINAINATDYAGMTLPRPTDVDGYIGSNWVDKNDAAVTTVPATPGINFIYADYKYNKYDYEGLGGVYDPNNRFSKGYLSSLYWDDFSPDSSKNISIRWYEQFLQQNHWVDSNLSYLAFTDGVNNKTGLTVKPNTKYKVTFDYYVTELPEKGKFGVQIRCVASSQIGVGGGTTIIGLTISDKVSEGTNWQTFTYEFTTPADVTATPYFALLFNNNGTRAKTDAEVFGKAFIDNIELIEVNAVNYEDAVADSYTSIREEIAANEQTSALRVSGAISEAAANAADEIGFIALPTKKAAANWYKFDKDGKLASGALSVKVKDVNGLGIKDAEGNDLRINELLAPSTVPVANGQKAYQVIITGLQTIGKTGAGLRNDAISVVLYTKDAEGNYTYYFANEVSYDQTMTMYAMAGKDFAKYEY